MKIDELSAPFPPDAISWRVGSMSKDKTKAKALAYLDARDVMRRLDTVCGVGNWQARYPHVGTITVCEIGIRIDGEWVWKANGAGQTDIEAEKGALSDAFKRAAVLWGIGQYLYDIDSPWVRIDGWKQIEKDELPRLRSLLPGSPPQKTARQARNDGDWRKLAEDMTACGSEDELDVFLDTHAQMIAQMPKGWQGHWSEKVATVRKSFQRQAAE